jgi:hypothetical protein
MSQCINSVPLSKYHSNILAFGFQQGNEYDEIITFSKEWRSCGWNHLMRVIKTRTPGGNYELKKKYNFEFIFVRISNLKFDGAKIKPFKSEILSPTFSGLCCLWLD